MTTNEKHAAAAGALCVDDGELLTLSKREMFAAVAMAAEIAHTGMRESHDAHVASWAVEYADELLAALEARKP